jgi:hypothetical protein
MAPAHASLKRDLMLPVGETPLVDRNEAAAVAAYVVALAGVAATVDEQLRPPATLRIALIDIDRQLTITTTDAEASVTFTAPSGDADVAGTTDDIVHLATGRPVSDALTCDGAVRDYLTHLARVMA